MTTPVATPRIGRPAIGPKVQTQLPPEQHRMLLKLMRRRAIARQSIAARIVMAAGFDALRSRGEL